MLLLGSTLAVGAAAACYLVATNVLGLIVGKLVEAEPLVPDDHLGTALAVVEAGSA